MNLEAEAAAKLLLIVKFIHQGCVGRSPGKGFRNRPLSFKEETSVSWIRKFPFFDVLALPKFPITMRLYPFHHLWMTHLMFQPPEDHTIYPLGSRRSCHVVEMSHDGP